MKPLDLRGLPSSQEVMICRDQGYFPVLVNPAGDEILAVLRGGAGHLGITGRLDAVRSPDGGLTWEPPTVIVDSEADDRNPAVGLMPDGSIVLAYQKQSSYDEHGNWEHGADRLQMLVTRSADGGASWEASRPLSYEPMSKHCGYGHIITLPDGTALMPIYGPRLGAQEETPSHSYILRSRDGGQTWDEPSLIAEGYSETALLVLRDGALLAAMRSERPGLNTQCLGVCRSDDEGYTWSEPVRVTETSEHPADLTRLSNGWVLMVFGIRHEPRGVQGLISKDEGRTWEARRLILCDDLEHEDLGYPSTAKLGDRIVTAYYNAPLILKEANWEYHDRVVPEWQIDRGDFRGEGAFARALLYSEKELLGALT